MMANYERVVHVAQVDAATLPILCVSPRDTFCRPDSAHFINCRKLLRAGARVDATGFGARAAGGERSPRGLGYGCA
jgi:hypothetical protein